MSKDRRKLLHIHSSVNDKQPTPASLEIGELGVNNAKGNAFISTKNSDGEVVRFSEDGTVIDWIEMKEVFPYEGYVRGADNTISGVTESDLVENKSNIIIKINQVAASNSEYDEKINGAKDIYGNLVNPLSEDGYRDGAGIAIDMSPYVMIGSNPSFSSITSNCHTTLKGTTEIIGTDGDCGSALNVNVDNVCIDSNDSSTLYGERKTNIGVNCDGTKVSNETTINGNTIDVIAQGDDSSVSIDSCNEINVTSNNYVLKECANGVGSVTVSSTTISNSASTIENYACSSINEVTDKFNISECTEGSGSTNIVSHKEFKVVSNDITLEQSGDGVGKTLIKSCDEIKLESKNIILSSNGDCGSGQTTVESDDLCLVGEDKINVFGKETNVGLDCDGSEIATNTRIYGKGTLITTKDTEGEVYPSENDIEITAANNIKESADGIITIDAKKSLFEQAASISSDATGTTDGINYVHADKYVHIKSGDIALSPSLVGEGVNLKLDKDGALDLFASDNVCVQALNNVTLYGAEETNIGASCDGSESASTTTINGGKIIIDASSDKLGLTAIGDIDETSEGSINISANDSLCLYGGESASLFGYEVTKVGVNCNGEKSDEIVYYRTPKAGNCELHSNTIDDALDEVYDRSRISLTSTAHTDSSSGSNYSYTEYTLHQDTGTCDVAIPFTVKETIVAMSAETYPASSELLKKYTLWQYVGSERKEIGEINIPTCVSHLGRAKLVWTYGSVCNAANDSYDPGSKCDLSTGSTIIIPKTISDVTCGDVVNGSCLEVNKSVCVSGDITASRAIYSSDIKLKENIKPIDVDKISKANKIKLKSFNFKDDEEKRETYGVIAQEVEEIGLNELVHLKKDGNLGVDYTSLLILKNAYLENKCEELSDKINRLENEMMILGDFIRQKNKPQK